MPQNPEKHHFQGENSYPQLLKPPIPSYVFTLSRGGPLSFILASIEGYGGPTERSRGQKTGQNGPKCSNNVSKLLQIIQGSYLMSQLWSGTLCDDKVSVWATYCSLMNSQGGFRGTMSGPKPPQNAIFRVER